jgi:hypothetical protein
MTFPLNWLNDALKLSVTIFIGLFFFAILTLSFDYLGFIRLPEFGSLARPALILDALLFGSLSAAALGRVIYDIWMRVHRTRLLSQRREIRRLEAERERAAYELLVLRRLEYLSREEIRCIADSLRKREQSFFASVRSPLASNLMAKGLVWTPGGAHNQDLCPFLFVDFAWDALLARRVEFIGKDIEHKGREQAERERRLRRY